VCALALACGPQGDPDGALRDSLPPTALGPDTTAAGPGPADTSGGDPTPVDSALADVRLSVEPARVAPGDSVTLVLTNGSDAGIGYNLCSSALQRRSGTEWRELPSMRVCTMELRSLEGGEETRYGMSLPVDLEAGDYRFSARIERSETGESIIVSSAPFTVEPAGPTDS
jgi:hypothetical protein